MKTPLEVLCITDEGGFAKFESQWRDLAERAEVGEWFAGPDWVLPWMRSFGRSSRLIVYFVFRDGVLVGSLPFAVRSNRRLGSPLLESPFNSHTRRVGWISEKNGDQTLFAVMSYVRSQYPTASVRLPHIAEHGILEGQVRRTQSDLSLGAWSEEESRTAQADWSTGWNKYVEQRDARFMRNLRRHLRRTSDGPDWQVSHFRGTSALTDGWPQLLEIERKSWKHDQRTSIDTEPGAELFYRSVSQRFAARDRIALWVLSHRNAPVAHALTVESRATSYLLKNSFVEQYRSHSPGVALVWRAMEQSAASGMQFFDFLGDAESWKVPLATHTPRHFSWTIYPSYHIAGQAEAFLQRVVRPAYRWLKGLSAPKT